jgi:hypothetical protein
VLCYYSGAAWQEAEGLQGVSFGFVSFYYNVVIVKDDFAVSYMLLYPGNTVILWPTLLVGMYVPKSMGLGRATFKNRFGI